MVPVYQRVNPLPWYTHGQDTMKPSQYTPSHQGLFPTAPRAWQEAVWFGRSQHDKQNKLPSWFGGRDSMDPLFTAHTMWKQNIYNFASVVALWIDGGHGPHFIHLTCA
jgi:hypothetical protein